jgi:hypothetical protein
MARIILGVVVGFLAWPLVFVGSEMVLSAVWPEWYGTHQRAFTAAIKTGSAFTADNGILLIHIVCASVGAVVAGFVAALVARENKRAPLIAGLLLTAVALLKAVMAWPYVPVWYHVVFTVALLPLTIVGGRLKTTAPVMRS